MVELIQVQQPRLLQQQRGHDANSKLGVFLSNSGVWCCEMAVYATDRLPVRRC